MSEEKSLDIAGMGEIAKAIPEKSWNKLVNTACKNFDKLISPISETTSGIGRLIKARFDNYLDPEKVLITETFTKAYSKYGKKSGPKESKAKPGIIIDVIDFSSKETDETIKELWANLLAQEIKDGQVHPEIPKILSRLNSQDALNLSKLYSSSENLDLQETIAKIFTDTTLNIFPGGISFSAIHEDEDNFSLMHLENLKLAKKTSGRWKLTRFGLEFIKCISDPNLGNDNKDCE